MVCKLKLQPLASLGKGAGDPGIIVQRTTGNPTGDNSTSELQRSTTGLKSKLLNAFGFQSS